MTIVDCPLCAGTGGVLEFNAKKYEKQKQQIIDFEADKKKIKDIVALWETADAWNIEGFAVECMNDIKEIVMDDKFMNKGSQQ